MANFISGFVLGFAWAVVIGIVWVSSVYWRAVKGLTDLKSRK